MRSSSESKVCSRCKVERPFPGGFHRRKSARSGYSSFCKSCANGDAKAWARANRDKRNGYEARYRAANPGVHRDWYLRKTFGITLADQEAMLASQQGGCAICRKTLDSPHVDHDHATGFVRGLLCRDCNTGLGFFKDDADLLAIAIAYLYSARDRQASV